MRSGIACSPNDSKHLKRVAPAALFVVEQLVDAEAGDVATVHVAAASGQDDGQNDNPENGSGRGLVHAARLLWRSCHDLFRHTELAVGKEDKVSCQNNIYS